MYSHKAYLSWLVTLLATLFGGRASGADDRLPVPGTEVQQERTKLLRELYQKDWSNAKTDAEKSKMAEVLLDVAQKTGDDAAGRYVTLRVAKDTAVQAGNAEVALKAVDLMCQGFDVNGAEICRDVVQQLRAKKLNLSDKIQLSYALVEKAKSVARDSTRKNEMILLAKDLMIETDNVTGAIEAVRQMESISPSRSVALQFDTLKRMAIATSSAETKAAVSRAALQLIPIAISAEQFETAKQSLGLAREMAIRKDDKFVAATGSLESRISALLQLQTEYAQANAVLATQPTDPNANTTVGRYVCYVKGEWGLGLHHMAAGSDAKSQNAAKGELSNPANPSELMAVADAWYSVAQEEKRELAVAIWKHAQKWYQKATPTATGLSQTKVERRLADITKQLKDAEPELDAESESVLLATLRLNPLIKNRELFASGGNDESEKAVAAALHWLARHQMADGAWSLDEYTKKCTDATCTGHGANDADAAATALGLLPFLAAGHTHQSRSIYSQNVQRGLYWLMSHQKPDGDCTAGARGQKMYTHGLCAMALCETAAMVPTDQAVKGAAQKAINFILAAQNPGTGGWRYQPGDSGDTSVVGWQLCALKVAEAAQLKISPKGFDGAKKWLDSCAHGNNKELFSYTPESGATPTMSAVGLLCSQYLTTAKPGAAKTQAGLDYLMKNSPDATKNKRNAYYLYYATQVMHNVPGPQWDDWNQQMRRNLVESQEKNGCAAGSWSPDKPTKDQWGMAGGRLMVTSLSCLTLEVHYRYPRLFPVSAAARNAKAE